MEFKYFSRNGEVLSSDKAVVPLSNIEYQYGFGVYETIRVAHKIQYFLDEHIERLMNSAKVIGLEHSFSPELVAKCIAELLQKNEVDACNLKILLMGGREPTLNILCLNPLFSDKKLYRDGAHTVTYEYERAFPHAKTLNMLQSYLAYKKAKEMGAYDALLLDRDGRITEGTRTNFFALKGKTLYEASEDKILLGVTRKHVLEVAMKSGFLVEQKEICPEELKEYDGAFLCSTSSKIMPIRTVDDFSFAETAQALPELTLAFDNFLNGLELAR